MRRTKALNSNYTKEQLNTLFASIITSFMTTLNSSALNLSIPGIGDTFGVSAQAVGWVVTIYTLASVALSLPFGKLADLTSRVKVMRLGVLTFTAGCVLAIGAGSFTTFILLRLLQGVGAAMIFSTNNAVLMGALPPSQSGRALGSSVCATYIGLSVGPVTGGFLNSIFGWRSVLVMVSIVGLIALFVCQAKLPSDDGSFRGAREFDWQSAVFYGAGLICLMYGISRIGGESLVWIGEVLVGAMLMLVFIKRQLKLDEPLLKVSLFAGNRSFTYSNIAALMNYAATFAMSYLMSIYLQVIKDLPSRNAGLILIAAPLVQAIISPVAGRLSDKHSPYKLSSAGMGCCAMALLGLIFLHDDSSYIRIIMNLALMGVGFGIFSSPNTNAIMSSVSSHDSGVASSIVATMRNCGQTLSMAIVTIIISARMGKASLTAAEPVVVMSTIRIAFAVFSIICAVGMIIALKRNEQKE